VGQTGADVSPVGGASGAGQQLWATAVLVARGMLAMQIPHSRKLEANRMVTIHASRGNVATDRIEKQYRTIFGRRAIKISGLSMLPIFRILSVHPHDIFPVGR
jgi:hypothetical protein